MKRDRSELRGSRWPESPFDQFVQRKVFPTDDGLSRGLVCDELSSEVGRVADAVLAIGLGARSEKDGITGQQGRSGKEKNRGERTKRSVT